MENEIIGLLGIATLMGLLLLRVPIAIALILVSFAGIWIVTGSRAAWGILTVVPYDFAAKWTLSAIPMFLLMGYISFHAGLTKGLYDACKVWLVRLPGGLAITSIFASAGFASVTGSSIACAAAMGRIAVPEMVKARYDAGLATGSIAAAGTLGALIPPSILMIIYGNFVQVPISKLFIGGLGIGLLTAAAYVLVVLGRVLLKPSLAPRLDETPSWQARFRALGATWPVVALVLLVLGGMFSGLFTATEAGAVGAFLAIVFSFLRGVLTRQVLWRSLVDTLSTTGTLFIISVGANLLTRFLALSGAGDLISSSIIGLELTGPILLIGIALLYMLLGMFLEPLGAMLLTLPVLLPILDAADISLIWFGIFLLKLLEMGMITPPIGINVFVIKSVVGKLANLTTIFKGVLWFLFADVFLVLLLIYVPDVVTFLPSLMN